MSDTDKVGEMIHDIAVAGFLHPREGQSYPGSPALAKLQSLGSRLWVDTGDREKARSVWRKELSALTTNNTLANQVVQSGVMDDTIRQTVDKIKKSGIRLNDREMIYEIGFVVNCKIALRLVETFNTKVSVELHPDMSRDVEKSLFYARRYFRVNPRSFIIKIPLTPEGYLAVRRLAKEGIPINFTLGFSARQNELAARLSNPEYVNVFLGRLNAVVKDNGLGDGAFVGEKVTLATQRAIDRVKRENGSIKSRLIGASIRDGGQVTRLAGIDVLTIPPGALQEFLDQGVDPSQIESRRQHDYAVSISPAAMPRIQPLWEVSDTFRRAVDDLLRKNLDTLTGKELVACFQDHQEPLFHPYQTEELASIKRQGKIPKLADWDDQVPLDDLMTQSALQSFATDQEALDNRIRKFLA